MRTATALLLLTACNAWTRPTPEPPLRRGPEEQRLAAVTVSSECVYDGHTSGNRTGSGVMVSDWQVLTAMHVIGPCNGISVIHVSNSLGGVWRFHEEREWKTEPKDGVARIQIGSGDTLHPRLRPPSVRSGEIESYDVLFVQAASPRFEEHVVEATGWEYGGVTYGATFTYSGPTEAGNSGSGIYDIGNNLVGIHLGLTSREGVKRGARVTVDMIPH